MNQNLKFINLQRVIPGRNFSGSLDTDLKKIIRGGFYMQTKSRVDND